LSSIKTPFFAQGLITLGGITGNDISYADIIEYIYLFVKTQKGEINLEI